MRAKRESREGKGERGYKGIVAYSVRLPYAINATTTATITAATPPTFLPFTPPVRFSCPASLAVASKNPLPHVSPTLVHNSPCPPNTGLFANPKAYGILASNATYEARMDLVQEEQRTVEEREEEVELAERRRKGREEEVKVLGEGRREGRA